MKRNSIANETFEQFTCHEVKNVQINKINSQIFSDI